MYLTLWTLRVSSLYVYPHFTLCLSPALDSVYCTLHALDSIVTLCLSSIIIYVILSMASYGRTRLRGNPQSSMQLYLAFARSTTPIPAKGCAGTLQEPEK